jgi:signal transduction histidine kinase
VNVPRWDFDVPPREEPPSTARAISRAPSERYARLAVVPHSIPNLREANRNELLVDVAIALAAFAASLVLLAVGENEDGGSGVDALGVVLTSGASLPLVARRRAPLAVFVVTALASTALYGFAQPAGPPIGPTLAIYFLAAGGEDTRPRRPLTLGIVAMMLAAHATAGGLARDVFPGTELGFGVLVWGGAWLAGDRTRLRRERLAELEERAERAEREAERERRLAAAEERGRIARDLHDSAGHAINVILVHAGMGRLQSERDPERAGEAFETIEEVARETVGEIDQMVRVLREDAAVPENTGEVEPPPGLAALEGLVARHRAAGLRVTTTLRGEQRTLPPAVDRAAYRILQEALTNAARHGDGSAEVGLTFDDSAVEIAVTNPLAADRAAGGGHGIVGMRERAALLGGTLVADARDARFELRARLPLT